MGKDLRKAPISNAQRERLRLLKAVASGKRLMILDWLRDPRANFPEQQDGDLVLDGVCGLFIAQKLGISQPTAHTHLKALVDAGFLQSKRIKQWTFFKRDEGAIEAALGILETL